jgi:DNA-binding CsgD family transcriptional regulator
MNHTQLIPELLHTPATDMIMAGLVRKVTHLAEPSVQKESGVASAMRNPALEELLGRINMGVAIQANGGHFFYVSQSFSRIVGFSLEDVYAQGLDCLTQSICEHDKPLVEQLLQKSETAIRQVPDNEHLLRTSIDYNIVCRQGHLKRIYQHILTNALIHNGTHYTIHILQDYSGMHSSPVLQYRVSQLGPDDRFVSIASGEVRPPCPFQFSESEKGLLHQLAAGDSMKAIADEKKVRLVTMKRHRNNILKKTGAKNIMALMTDGLKQGWLELPMHAIGK